MWSNFGNNADADNKSDNDDGFNDFGDNDNNSGGGWADSSWATPAFDTDTNVNTQLASDMKVSSDIKDIGSGSSNVHATDINVNVNDKVDDDQDDGDDWTSAANNL